MKSAYAFASLGRFPFVARDDVQVVRVLGEVPPLWVVNTGKSRQEDMRTREFVGDFGGGRVS